MISLKDIEIYNWIRERKKGKGNKAKAIERILGEFVGNFFPKDSTISVDKKYLDDGRIKVLGVVENARLEVVISDSEKERRYYENNKPEAKLKDRSVQYIFRKLYQSPEKLTGLRRLFKLFVGRKLGIIGREYIKSSLKEKKFQLKKLIKHLPGVIWEIPAKPEFIVGEDKPKEPKIMVANDSVSNQTKSNGESVESSDESNQAKKEKRKENPIQSNLRIFKPDKSLIKISLQVKPLFLYARAPPNITYKINTIFLKI